MPAAGVALPPQPRALPAGRGRATSTCCTRRAGCGRRGWSRAACRSLEAALLGFHRVGDVPGAEIPQHLLRLRAPARRPRHGPRARSTTGWTSSPWPRWPCWPASGSRKAGPRTRATCFALARVLERAALFDQSEADYRRLVLATRGRCACRRCCAWPTAPSARAISRSRCPCGKKPRTAATGGRCASWRATTSTAAATWKRRSSSSTAASTRSSARPAFPPARCPTSAGAARG